MHHLNIRQATPADAAEISDFLEDLTRLGKRNLPSDAGFVRDHYINHADTIRCSVATDQDGSILGLQILKRATPGNPYDVATGWGIIGTHVKPGAARRGIGKSLFAATLHAAQSAGLTKIDATIGAQNTEGLGYYDAMGFRTYKSLNGRVCKCFDLPA